MEKNLFFISISGGNGTAAVGPRPGVRDVMPRAARQHSAAVQVHFLYAFQSHLAGPTLRSRRWWRLRMRNVMFSSSHDAAGRTPAFETWL
jgi:hypothetical protein